MFDPPAEVAYAAVPMSVVGCSEHRRLAYEAAVKSIVLLKNRNNFLPIGEKAQKILVVGPTAASIEVLLATIMA